MGWCEADSKIDLNYFFTKDEWINRGVAIQMDPAQRPQILSALMEDDLVMARVHWYQAPYSLPRSTAPAYPDSRWL